jgi:FliG C-terminal domain
MDALERIVGLDRVKLQLLINWLSNEELVALIEAGDQELEDLILDNISRQGRALLLEDLGFSEADYMSRLAIRKKLNALYAEKVASEPGPPARARRREIIEECAASLPEAERAAYDARFKERAGELSEGLARKLEDFLGKLDRGEGLRGK